MVLNPYAAHLDGHDPLAILATTASRLNTLARRLSSEQLDAPRAPGKWSPRELLAHLADCELVFSFRLRQTLAEPAILQPFDQDIWAQRYAAYDGPSALALFTSARAWNLNLLTTLKPGDTERIATHPERGTMSFRTILETMAGHDINHLRQLESIA